MRGQHDLLGPHLSPARAARAPAGRERVRRYGKPCTCSWLMCPDSRLGIGRIAGNYLIPSRHRAAMQQMTGMEHCPHRRGGVDMNRPSSQPRPSRRPSGIARYPKLDNATHMRPASIRSKPSTPRAAHGHYSSRKGDRSLRTAGHEEDAKPQCDHCNYDCRDWLHVRPKEQ